ncbi:MAG TPA: aminotransferase class III-fold pyridoxal phosphate-dependent enzyme, partial [Thermohalobaculum sp.]|nr:aminotransferase class III-fold pyridoxal phosphate-dependent enzyme [Thermohalobaculum sp.]
EYRDRRPDESAAEYGQRAANELEAEIERLGPRNVMAFVAEPVVGATLGAVPPTTGYFRRIREICDRRGVLMILDEVMCGMGRTGTLFACEQEGVAPDILCIAKGLGAGYQPIGAALCTDTIHDAIAEGSGAFMHGHTYMGHPVACAAAGVVVEKLSGGLAERAMTMGEHLDRALHDAFGQHPHVGDIRGSGLFRGIELVEDRESKAPFDPGRKVAARLKKAAQQAGLICYPMSGTIDGKRGDHVLLAPPFILEDAHVAELVEKLGTALDATLRA